MQSDRWGILDSHRWKLGCRTAATSMSGHVSLPAAGAIPRGQQQELDQAMEPGMEPRMGQVKGMGMGQMDEVKGDSWSNQLPDMLVAYYRQHGVQSLMLVVCHVDIGELSPSPLPSPLPWVAIFMNHLLPLSFSLSFTRTAAANLQLLLQHFTANNFYVQVNTERTLNDLRHVSKESDTPEAPPPRTFPFQDNETHWQLSFQLPALSYKLGILLLQFSSPCAQNLLRWSAASENNYLTTNRYWLLLTQDLQDVNLLEDAEIFIPPDSELKVMWYNPTEPFTATLLDVYKVAAWKPLKRRLVGQNLRNSRHVVHALRHYGSPITYRQNLEGIVFNTAIVIAFPDLFTNIEDMSMRHIDTISKVNHRLMLELANRLNMRYVFLYPAHRNCLL